MSTITRQREQLERAITLSGGVEAVAKQLGASVSLVELWLGGQAMPERKYIALIGLLADSEINKPK